MYFVFYKILNKIQNVAIAMNVMQATNDKVQTKVQTLLFKSFVQIDKFELSRIWTQANVNSRVTADKMLSL